MHTYEIAYSYEGWKSVALASFVISVALMTKLWLITTVA